MRKLNAILAMGTVVMFLVHAVMGGMILMGFIPGGNTVMKVLAEVMMICITGHVILSIKLTADTVIAVKRSGAHYFKENKMFWIRRISGLAVMLFIVAHLEIFGKDGGDPVRLALFEGPQLVTQLLLVVSLIVHILTNIRPLMLSLGAKSYKELALDIVLILSMILLFAGAGFAVYYFRWQA